MKLAGCNAMSTGNDSSSALVIKFASGDSLASGFLNGAVTETPSFLSRNARALSAARSATATTSASGCTSKPSYTARAICDASLSEVAQLPSDSST